VFEGGRQGEELGEEVPETWSGDQREEPEVEIADEAWGEQASGPSVPRTS